jgi:diaminopimelate epimerase
VARAAFRKYQALGNDYVVIDPAFNDLKLTPAAVRTLCDRRYGIGADGVLYGPVVETAGFGVRIFNPDGGEAEKSGNGVRIFDRYLRDCGYVTGETGTVLTAGGAVAFRYLDPGAKRIQLDMGEARFLAEHMTLEVGGRTVDATSVSMGNPHCVVLGLGATEELARTLGPLIERHEAFPDRTNVQFVEVMGRDLIRIQIWERGAGYTLASGTSSCAAASAAHRLGLVDAKVKVAMPGGELDIEIGDDWRVRMTGDVRATIEGELSADLMGGLGVG